MNKPECIAAGCDREAKYWSEMTRPCGCYHPSFSTPRMCCIVHAAFYKEQIHAERATPCRQCGEVSRIKLLSLKTILWPKEQLAA